MVRVAGPEPIVFTEQMAEDFRRLVLNLTMFDMGARYAGRVSIALPVWRELVLEPAMEIMRGMPKRVLRLEDGDQ